MEGLRLGSNHFPYIICHFSLFLICHLEEVAQDGCDFIQTPNDKSEMANDIWKMIQRCEVGKQPRTYLYFISPALIAVFI